MIFTINVLLNGSKGKMGTVFSEYIKDYSEFNLKYCVDKENSNLFNSISEKPDVIVDFSVPTSTFNCLNYAVENLVPVVIATTGFSTDEETSIKEYSEAIPIFKSGNLSYGINLMSYVSAILAQNLEHSDIEIIDKHHRNKVDLPSGTALLIANNINKTCNNKFNYILNKERFNHKDKKYNEISFSSIRGGNIIGEHTVMFMRDDEIIEVTHKSFSRKIYIEGALKAIKFIISKKNGLFSMEDLLNFS